jgi:CopG family nickel-responsive transcriptional regulator
MAMFLQIYQESAMGDLSRFGVSIEESLLESFDQLIASQGYLNRSEALRDLIRDALVRQQLERHPDKAQVLATLTLVYDHHARDLSERMAEIQHESPELVVSVLHVHVSHDDCMEAIVLRGRARQVRELSDSLLSLKGVKHGGLFVTLPTQEIGMSSAAARHVHHVRPKS